MHKLWRHNLTQNGKTWKGNSLALPIDPLILNVKLSSSSSSLVCFTCHLEDCLSRFVYKGILLSLRKTPLNNHRNVIIWLQPSISSTPPQSFPYSVRSNAAETDLYREQSRQKEEELLFAQLLSSKHIPFLEGRILQQSCTN